MFDIVSDLHIDQWDKNIGVKYPCGVVKHYPYMPIDPQNKILVVAGDVSDSLQNTIAYLDAISKYYQKILFVDGNHEHVNAFPNLYTCQQINEEISKLNNDKIIYLPSNPYVHNDTLFLGMCGWWDYNNSDEESMKKCMNYFDSWIPHFKEKENKLFINNVIKEGQQQINNIIKSIDEANDNDIIKNIIIVSHCVPLEKYCCQKEIATQYHSNVTQILDNKILTSKIKKWIFGHIHHNICDTHNNIKFIAHPRGRPEDFNRILYDTFEAKL